MNLVSVSHLMYVLLLMFDIFRNAILGLQVDFSCPFDPYIDRHMHQYVPTMWNQIVQYNMQHDGVDGPDAQEISISLKSNFFISLDNACKGKIVETQYAFTTNQCVEISQLSSNDIGNVILKYCALEVYLIPSNVAMTCQLIKHCVSIFLTMVDTELYLNDDNRDLRIDI